MSIYTIEELNKEGIWEWNLIEKNFMSTSILLGNGFSINFSNSLRYKYLYEFFIRDCTEPAAKLFEEFDSKNFERILESLEVAELVCNTLEITSDKFEKYKTEIKEGLISSINQMHPKPINVDQLKIKHVSNQFKDFTQVFTTNYDLFLYYIILESHKFGDHFFNKLPSKYNYFENPDEMKSHHIYYLHGALFLFGNSIRTKKLLKSSDNSLLELITEEIDNDNYPLFISEGKSRTKLKAIRSNPYLNLCLSQLENNSDSTLIIYGQSLSDQDEHLIKVIDKNYKNIAVSIRSEDWSTLGKLKAEKYRLSSLFKKAKFEFYDSKTLFNFDV